MISYAVPGARYVALVAVLVLTACLFASCAAGKAEPDAGTQAVEGEVVVFAASSLTDAFKEAAAVFREMHPGARVSLSFASSASLAAQINEGAPADVFASADGAQMTVVVSRGNAGTPVVFATNRPILVVPRTGSPVASFADLARPGVRLVLAAPEVPIGRYSREILARASGTPAGPGADFGAKALANLRSNEANVRAVLTKVQLGEADAGIVYATDAASGGSDIRVISIPPEYNVLAEYPIAVTSSARNVLAASAWLAFLLSGEGQAVLEKYGFGRREEPR